MNCSVHNKPIRGKVHFWNNRPMCTNCYRHHCVNIRLVRKPRPSSPTRSPYRNHRGNTLLDRLLRWF
jgi:hypothetical protein